MGHSVMLGLGCLVLWSPGHGEASAGEGEPPAPVEQYGVFELTLKSEATYANPFTEATLHAVFTGPDKQTVELDGFHYKGTEWKARFVPGKLGVWEFSAELKGKGDPVKAQGRFECVAGKRHGFVRISKKNPYRFEYDDGTPFYPIGQQCGWGAMPHMPFDGPDEKQWVNTDAETFMKAFDGATNLIRSQLGTGTTAGVALDLLPGKDGLDRYDVENCLKLDESCRIIKAHDWAQIMILFQDMSMWGDGHTAFGGLRDTTNYKSLKSPHLAELDAYCRYVVARYAAYVDIWEIYNEDAYSPPDYLAHLAKTIRDADPYKRPIMTSYERPNEPWCEILSVHEYMGCSAAETPGYMAKEFGRLKSWNKPVLYTEYGNQASLGNVDPVKWRVAEWTAYMNECSIGFWNMSGRKVPPKDKGGPVNAWLGPDSRQHFKVLADFTRDLPVNMRPCTPSYTSEMPIQTWALTNGDVAVLYVHNFKDHTQALAMKESVWIWVGTGNYHIKWIDPETGKLLGEADAEAKGHSIELKLPEFKIDLAARIERKKE